MKKIAIVGSGISGLVCAHLLSKQHAVTLFEANDYIGGHTATKTVHAEGRDWNIDTGFIVFNDRTYPNFNRLLEKIGLVGQETEMSFSVKNIHTGLEYNGNNLNSLFAQRSNLLNPQFLFLIRSILRFNHQCKLLYNSGEVSQLTNITLGDFLENHNYNQYFAEHYILPMGAAIWSASLDDMRAFPLKFFIQFFYNHGLLDITNRPQWSVIPGGSKTYIPLLLKDIESIVQLNSAVTKVERVNGQVKLTINGNDNEAQMFDEVILASHSNQSRKMLVDKSELEDEILSMLTYQENEVVLHTDESLLPEAKLAWAAWNYSLDTSDNRRPTYVTYNMNILQGLTTDHTTFCVSLNNGHRIDPDKVLGRYLYDHPVFNQNTISAQQRREEICGHNHTHFAGAYWYNGFHEDGVKSALDICRRFGLTLSDTSL
ncbi:FAD-dependent oxidoreductase [Vibrio sp. SS-MA-C1-2]|uniref:NAD(P)/FAD-dependent oxidoreductase n=1 Tax=Vibrio sp. SS-MA-C1-2 TaxID=2908646 RepID=UPI001F32AEB4|nr:FAD-dependent oxidoreductase [Vibrio sp. SS-MA-C1-2]UJF18364.1 FAD-dependent oxidoreductase [Vibrio sp. SS-MA-C1-2]